MDESQTQSAHVFLDVPVLSHAERNRQTAEEFCRAYARQYGTTASVTGVEDNALDALAVVGGREVALELVGYRQRDEHLEAEHGDSIIKERISTALAESDLPPYQVRLWWKQEVRRKRQRGSSPGVAKIPRGQQVERFAEEFVKLVRYVDRNPDLAGRKLLLRPPGRVPRAPMPWGIVDASRFPLVASYCEHVTLEAWPHAFKPMIRSSADARHLGLDMEQLAKKVRDKIDKLPTYRKRACARPVWLVVHSEGWPLSSRMYRAHRDQAIGTVAVVARESPERFDEVWWAENTAYIDAAAIFKVEIRS